uniref:C-type lectin domain-containing protein n=1 Tax=Acrobeloides nanus TaxID=290746 RepID=A0A914E0U3_9BILA
MTTCTGPLTCDQTCAKYSNATISYHDGPFTGTCSAFWQFIGTWQDATKLCKELAPPGANGSLVSVTSPYIRQWMMGALTEWQNCSLDIGSCIENNCTLGVCGANGNCTMKLNTKSRFWLSSAAFCNNFDHWEDGSRMIYSNWATGQPNYNCFNNCSCFNDNCTATGDKNLKHKIASAQLIRKEYKQTHEFTLNSGSIGTVFSNCGTQESELCLQMEFSTGQWYTADCFEPLYGAFCIFKF